MGLLLSFKSWLLDDYCTKCKVQMRELRQQLYMLPTMTVGHYQSHDNPRYYVKNLVKVKQRSEIPAGFYACKTYVYQCPVCQKKIAKLLVFLPVRDKGQLEDNFLYEDPALLRFLEEK